MISSAVPRPVNSFSMMFQFIFILRFVYKSTSAVTGGWNIFLYSGQCSLLIGNTVDQYVVRGSQQKKTQYYYSYEAPWKRKLEWLKREFGIGNRLYEE